MIDTDLREALDQIEEAGGKLRLWLRDDDAVMPSPALDQLLDLTSSYDVPVTLAVIPQHTDQELAQRLVQVDSVTVAVHGWSHRNHARPGEKKQELGSHRTAKTILAELSAGREKLAHLHGCRFVPMLVPPWNRIDAALLPFLDSVGFTSLSVFGREPDDAPISHFNTHLDIMDWHGTGGGRAVDVLLDELVALIKRDEAPPKIGVLTHHLVHDAVAWSFLEKLFSVTSVHPACEWVRPLAN